MRFLLLIALCFPCVAHATYIRSGNATTLLSTTCNGSACTQGDAIQIDANNNGADAGSPVGNGVASFSTTCPASGPSTGAVILSGGNTINAQTGTSYPIVTGDCGKVLTLSNGSAVAVSLPQAGTTGFATGWYLAGVQNLGAGTVTITPATSTINGSATLTLASGQGITSLTSDGTNYTAVTGKTTAVGATISGTPTTGDCAQWASSTSVGGASVAGCGFVSQTANDASYYPFLDRQTVAVGAAVGAGKAVCSPFYFRTAAHIDVVQVGTTTAGTSNTQLAIYNDSINAGGRHQPGTNNAHSSDIVNTATAPAVLSWTGTSIAVPAGLNWVCENSNDGTVVFYAYSAASAFISSLIGSTTASHVIGTGHIVGLSVSETYGTWPDFTSSSFTDVVTALPPESSYRLQTVP